MKKQTVFTESSGCVRRSHIFKSLTSACGSLTPTHPPMLCSTLCGIAMILIPASVHQPRTSSRDTYAFQTLVHTLILTAGGSLDSASTSSVGSLSKWVWTYLWPQHSKSGKTGSTSSGLKDGLVWCTGGACAARKVSSMAAIWASMVRGTLSPRSA